MNAPIDLRKDDRYSLSAPVFLFWAPQNDSSHGSQGVTRDISANGVYVNADESPAVGETVQMDILFPNPAPGEPEIHLTAEGVVFRIETPGTKFANVSNHGFAASVRFCPRLSEWIMSHLKDSGRVT